MCKTSPTQYTYALRIGRPTGDGQRQVQLVRQQLDPVGVEPIGDPVILEPDDDELTLALDVDVAVGMDSRGGVFPVVDEDTRVLDDGIRGRL